MPNEINKLCDTIMEQVDKVIEQRVAKASYDRSFIGIISEVLFDETTQSNNVNYERYKVFYNNAEQKIYIRDGLIHSIGDKLLITLPLGNVNNKIVEVLTKNAHPVRVAYNNTNDTIIETWRNNLGKYVTRTYALTIENKGEDNELVKELIFPDGTIMNLEDFVINE